METVSAFDAVARSLIGQPISHVWRGHGSAIFLEIGELTTPQRLDASPGNPAGSVSIGVEWSWRIEDADSILCGSWSEEELWPAAFDRLREGRIEACGLFGALPEIELVTDLGVRLLSFSTTEGQPQWFLIDRRGEVTCSFDVDSGKLRFGA